VIECSIIDEDYRHAITFIDEYRDQKVTVYTVKATIYNYSTKPGRHATALRSISLGSDLLGGPRFEYIPRLERI
jgi:hypothetical protein